MVQEDIERRLVAILAADVAGYSRLMEADEEATARTLHVYREIVDGFIASHHGRVFGSAGDSVIAEFASPVEAVRCAVKIQGELEARNVDTPEDRRMRFRIGVNLGDVMVEGDNLLGDGVNIAARLEKLADAGGICLSRPVFDQVKKQLHLDYEYLGEHDVKNITEPIRVYRVAGEPKSSGSSQISERAAKPRGSPSLATVSDTPTSGAARRDIFGKPSIVILPFENLSGDPEQEYFCHGLTQDITTDLSKFPNLFVIAANSAFHYMDTRSTPQDVARELGVRYLLEGSVQKSGDAIRVNAQLIDATTAGHLWAERFLGDSQDLFALQDVIIQKIVVALAFKVEAVEQERALRKDPVDMNAYEAYLKGLHLFSYQTEEALEQCRAMFKRAAELDPSFARAWGYMAYCEVRAVLGGWKDSEAFVEAEALAKRAVELDSDDYANHWDLAYVYLNSGRFDQALSEYRRAILLNPNDADLLAEMAEMLVYTGRPEEAIAQISQAMVINPRFPDWYRWNLGWAAYNAKDYDGALEQLNQMSDPPNDVRLFVAAAHAQLGDVGAAEAALGRFLDERASPYTIADVRKRGRFKHRQDEEHWLDGLRKAGLPD